MKAACHCGAVRFEIAKAPEWVLDCNCTVCRRYGAMWSYYMGPDQAQLLSLPAPGTTDVYTWLDHEIGFHRCKVCGCISHLEARDRDPPVIFGVNARLMVTLDPRTVRIVQKDNGHTGWFWTRGDGPVSASQHPWMPLPGPDDWR